MLRKFGGGGFYLDMTKQCKILILYLQRGDGLLLKRMGFYSAFYSNRYLKMSIS